MKTKFINLLITFFISIGLLATTNIAQAFCKWVPGHYNQYGYYISKHKICYPGHNRHHRYYYCKWIYGHYNEYGHYITKHKVCFYKYR